MWILRPHIPCAIECYESFLAICRREASHASQAAHLRHIYSLPTQPGIWRAARAVRRKIYLTRPRSQRPNAPSCERERPFGGCHNRGDTGEVYPVTRNQLVFCVCQSDPALVGYPERAAG